VYSENAYVQTEEWMGHSHEKLVLPRSEEQTERHNDDPHRFVVVIK
jgi:hypothetical protein